jgi:hypothetical protein
MSGLGKVLGPEATGRSLRIWRLFAETRAKLAGAQRWQVMVIGVLPAGQGRGMAAHSCAPC